MPLLLAVVGFVFLAALLEPILYGTASILRRLIVWGSVGFFLLFFVGPFIPYLF